MARDQEIKDREVQIITSNRRATYDYHIEQKMEAGIKLLGTEVKSLRNGKCSLQEAFVGFPGNNPTEMYILNMTIPEYSHANINNHDPKRKRKLLVHDYEARRWYDAVKEKGLTIVPLNIYFSGHLVKLEIALVKPKKKYDKRESTKKKEVEREIRRKYKV